MVKHFYWLVPMLIILSSCGAENRHEDSFSIQHSKVHNPKWVDQEAVHTVESYEEVTKAVAIHIDNELLVAIQLKQWDKFRTKSIEKKLKEKLKSEFPEHTITLSSDLKIFIETKKIVNRSQKGLEEKEINKRVHQIIKLSNEQT
ncbi:YhcN/YlaJ family sporulation lipoprotein [Bacillus timonensis]|nr:YhcN/YlaJ family sporulation lipoprotein [Bacillus timonensis]